MIQLHSKKNCRLSQKSSLISFIFKYYSVPFNYQNGKYDESDKSTIYFKFIKNTT